MVNIEEKLKFRKQIQENAQKVHEDTYINFRKEADKHKLTKDELGAKLSLLKEQGYTYIKHTTLRAHMTQKSYSLATRRDIISLTIFENNKYEYYYTNYRDDKKNVKRVNPFPEFKNKFNKRTGISLLDAFGGVKQELKCCVPMPLYYISPFFVMNKKIGDISKEDFSSHYPWAASKALPDANTAIMKKGRVLPDHNYKFAFYPDSGNIAVYNEFNTRDYLYEVEIISGKVKKERLFKAHYKAKDTRTILMKEAEYTLADEMLHYYNIKNTYNKESDEYNKAKLFMNMFIGMFEQNKHSDYLRNPYAHLAAVIKWRANIKMFKLIRQIGLDKVLQVCVDGIIHQGKAIGTTINNIGNLITEADRKEFIQRGINQYILYNGDNIVKAHAGLDIDIDSNNITDWRASEKVRFLEYLKTQFEIEEI